MPATTFEKHHFQYARNPRDIQAILIKRTGKPLEARVGKKYKNVILKFLKGEFSNFNTKLESSSMLQSFRAEVVDLLKGAAEIV